MLTLIPALLASSAFPLLARAARDDRERLHYAIGRLSQGMLILGAWIAVALGLGAPLAIDVVAGPEFEPAVEPLRIQAVALLGTSLLAVWGYGLALARASPRDHARERRGRRAGRRTRASRSFRAFGAVGAAVSLTAAELGLAAGYGLALRRSDPGLMRRLGAAPRILIGGRAGARRAARPRAQRHRRRTRRNRDLRSRARRAPSRSLRS